MQKDSISVFLYISSIHYIWDDAANCNPDNYWIYNDSICRYYLFFVLEMPKMQKAAAN